MSAPMINVTLPDGTVLEVPPESSIADVAAAIGPGLAKAAVAGQIDGETVDLSARLSRDAAVRILTERDEDALAVLRHSAAHVLATAVRELRPGAGIGFGPAIDDGFYYDFDVPEPFTPADLETFEAKMAEVAKANYGFERRVVSVEEARELFSDDPLKLERLDEFSEDEIITVYQDGPFLDLCRGPHVPSTGSLKHFKLLSGAGAYWRGDEKRQMLQRIYGTAFFKKSHLSEHLERLEEAKKRDHRVLGRELDLFSTDARVGPGLILWHPKGATIRSEIEQFEQELILRHGYDLVYTPHVMSERIFEISGHLENFKDGMFGALDMEGAAYRPKPMNCPGHIAIYQSQQRSYRDLPIRMAEFGTCYRYERSGVLHGMLRVRGFTQDDAHVFCTPDQVPGEIERLLDLVDEILTAFGYPYYDLARNQAGGEGAGHGRAVETPPSRRWLIRWSHGACLSSTTRAGEPFTGRSWTSSSSTPSDGSGRVRRCSSTSTCRIGSSWSTWARTTSAIGPIMLHRVLVGSMERFVGGLIEHYAGAFPTWLAPEQVRVLPISEHFLESASDFVAQLKAAGVRAVLADRETLSYRIRDAEMHKIPYMAVIGEREVEAGTVTVRKRGAGKKQEIFERAGFVEQVKGEIERRALE